jgi:hypothetical protein
MLLAGVITLSAGFAADKNKDHNDAFVPGAAGETHIARVTSERSWVDARAIR